jgi:protein-serine/threonine kinase
MEAMAAKAVHLDASKRHGSRWDGFPKPKMFGGSSPSSLQVTNMSPPTRTPSPMLSDVSLSVSGAVTPLPSPLLGPHLEIEPPTTPGTKTNAFFGSSWKSLIPKPATPPQSKHHQTKSTDSGVIIHSSPLRDSSAPVDIPTLHPDVMGAAAADDERGGSVPVRSQTINFFNSPSKHIPSPPPSIRHLSPDEKPDSAAALRLQLARLSPARAQPTVGTDENELGGGSHSRSSSHSSGHGFSKHPRDFVYWTPESSDLSRSSSRSSVSGIRRDFAFTPINPSSSYSPSNLTSSPLSRLRQLDDTPVSSSPSELLTPKPNDFAPDTPTGPAVPQAFSLVRRETQRNPGESHLQNGMVIGDEAPLVLVRILGQGAFSSVWLARDIEDRLIPPGPRQRRRKSVSTARKKGDILPGLRPAAQATTRLGVLNELDGEGAILPTSAPELSHRPLEAPSKVGKLVAVKMLDRTLCDVNDRTRVSFVREVEVLRVSSLFFSPRFIRLTIECFLSHSISRILLLSLFCTRLQYRHIIASY